MKKLSIKQKEHIKEVLKKVAIGFSIGLNIFFVIILIGSLVISSKQKGQDTVHTEIVKSRFTPNGNASYITQYTDINAGVNLNTDVVVNGSFDEGVPFSTDYLLRFDYSDSEYATIGNYNVRIFSKGMSWAFFNSVFNYKDYASNTAISYASNETYQDHAYSITGNVACIGVIPLMLKDGSVSPSIVQDYYDTCILIMRNGSANSFSFYLRTIIPNSVIRRDYLLFRFSSNIPYAYLLESEYNSTILEVYEHLFNNDDIVLGVCNYLNNNDLTFNPSYVYQGPYTRCVEKFISYFTNQSFYNVSWYMNFNDINDELFANGQALLFDDNLYSKYIYKPFAGDTSTKYVNFMYGDFYYNSTHYNSIRAIFEYHTNSEISHYSYTYTGEPTHFVSGLPSTPNTFYILSGFDFYDTATGHTQYIGSTYQLQYGYITFITDTLYYADGFSRNFISKNIGIYHTFYGIPSFGYGSNYNAYSNYINYVGYIDNNYTGYIDGGSVGALTNVISIINLGFGGITSLFGYAILPGITLGTLFAIPLTLTLLLFVIKLFKR